MTTLKNGEEWIRSTSVPQHQNDSLLNQAAPVQNTWYTVLAATYDVELIRVVMAVLTTGETLECRITVDGTAHTVTGVAAVAGTSYAVYFVSNYTGKYLVAIADDLTSMVCFAGCPLSCRAVTVEVRKTTAAGAGNLRGSVTYSRYT